MILSRSVRWLGSMLLNSLLLLSAAGENQSPLSLTKNVQFGSPFRSEEPKVLSESSAVADIGPLRVVGRSLQNRYGGTVLLRGVNVPVYKSGYVDDLEAVASVVASSGANAVRLVWWGNVSNGWPNGGAPSNYTLQNLDRAITKYAGLGLVPIIELHDVTRYFAVGMSQAGAWNDQNLFKARITDFWTRADVMAIILKHQNHLVVNFANEWGGVGDGSGTASQYVQNYVNAITAVRTAWATAGIGSVPLMVDAPDGGSNADVLLVAHATQAGKSNGQVILAADPLNNTLLSVHTYWPASAGYSDASITARLDQIRNSGLPIVLGEVGATAVTNQPCDPVNWNTVLTQANARQIGTLVWVWYEEGSCNVMNLTPDGLTLPTDNGAQTFSNLALRSPVYGLKTATRIDASNQMRIAGTLAAVVSLLLDDAAPPPPSAGTTFAFDYVTPNLTKYAASQGAPCLTPAGNKITLKIPGTATAANKLPLLVVLAGGDAGAPVGQYTDELNNLGAIGDYAVVTFSYSTCGYSSPLVFADPDNGNSAGEFSAAMDAIRAYITANVLNVNLNSVAVLGISWSSNYIRTASVKYGTAYKIQGVLSVAGGCNFGCRITGTAYEEPNAYGLVNAKAQVVAAISNEGDTLYLSLAKLPRNGAAQPICASPGYDYGLGADAAKYCFKQAIPLASRPVLIAYMDPNQGGHATFSAGTEAVKRQFIRYLFGLDAIPASLAN